MSLMSLATVGNRPANTPRTPSEEEMKAINAGSLQRLVDFIPVESITLFWLAIPFAKGLAKLAGEDAAKRDAAGAIVGGAGGDLAKNAAWNWELTAYLSVMALTPIFLMLVYFKRKSGLKVNGAKPPFPPRKEWPWWRALAATIAFAAWGLAVPGSTIIRESEVSTMGMWVLAFVVSTLLSLLDPIILTWVCPAQNPDPA